MLADLAIAWDFVKRVDEKKLWNTCLTIFTTTPTFGPTKFSLVTFVVWKKNLKNEHKFDHEFRQHGLSKGMKISLSYEIDQNSKTMRRSARTNSLSRFFIVSDHWAWTQYICKINIRCNCWWSHTWKIGGVRWWVEFPSRVSKTT